MAVNPIELVHIAPWTGRPRCSSWADVTSTCCASAPLPARA